MYEGFEHKKKKKKNLYNNIDGLWPIRIACDVRARRRPKRRRPTDGKKKILERLRIALVNGTRTGLYVSGAV